MCVCYEMEKRCVCSYNMDNSFGRKNISGCEKKVLLGISFSFFLDTNASLSKNDC